MSRALSVDHALLDFLFLHALRVDRVFQAVITNLQPEHLLHAHELHYRGILCGAMLYYEQYNELPTSEALWTNTLRIMSRDETCGQEQLMEAKAAIDEWFNETIHPQSALEPNMAFDCLKQVLLERKIGVAAQEISNNMNLSSAIDFGDFVDRIQQQHTMIQRIQHQELPLALPEVWEADTGDTMSTGVPFIDRMVGGSRPGDSNVLIGPSGVAKTLLGIQMLCGRAKAAYTREQQTGERQGISVYISYEDRLHSLRSRMLSCACQIHRDITRSISSYDELSTQDNMRDYERQLFVGREALCEQARYMAAQPWINEHIMLVDFSNHPDAMGGAGGINEIRGLLGRVSEERERPIGETFIDYAGLTAQRYLEHRDGHTDRLVKELGEFVDKVGHQLSMPFNMVSWTLHQVNGKAQQASPTAKLSHTNAEWCKAFANNAYLAMVLGTKDVRSSACMLAATKTRNARTPPPMVCRIAGELSCLQDATQELQIDPMSNSLKPRNEVDRFQDRHTSSNAPVIGIGTVDQDVDEV